MKGYRDVKHKTSFQQQHIDLSALAQSGNTITGGLFFFFLFRYLQRERERDMDLQGETQHSSAITKFISHREHLELFLNTKERAITTDSFPSCFNIAPKTFPLIQCKNRRHHSLSPMNLVYKPSSLGNDPTQPCIMRMDKKIRDAALKAICNNNNHA